MMNSYRPNNRGGRKGRRRLLFATAAVILLFLVDGISGGYIRAFVRAGASSLWNSTHSAADGILGSGVLSTRRALQKENESLREELSQLRLRAAGFDVLQRDNEALRGIVHLAETANGVTAPVVSSFRSSPYGTFLIGAGTASGVREGDLVMMGDPRFGGFVIGRVNSVDSNRSLVKELFAPDESIEATVSGISVLLEGRGGGQARAEVPRDADIVEGDVVISATAGGKSVGIVGNVEEDAGRASKTLYVNIPVNLYEIQYVYVLSE